MEQPEPAAIVRDVHNAVAGSANDAEASTRPPTTSPAEIRRMVGDVLAKLEIGPTTTVIEIGCGTGVLGLPIARLARRYVGVDFAEKAVDVLEGRMASAGLTARTGVVRMDFLGAPGDELARLGRFDRVLVYATLHYSPDADRARYFVERAIGLLGEGGIALFGNLPVNELAAKTGSLRSGSPVDRLRALARWLRANESPVPRSLSWKLRGMAYRLWRKAGRMLRPSRPFEAATLPAGAAVTFSVAEVEAWIDGLPDQLAYRWAAPAVGIPIFGERADLLVTKLAEAP